MNVVANKDANVARQDREDKDYAIDAVAKALKVFEALEGRSFEPVNIARVAQRTGFGRDFCFRALKTLKVAGYAKETLDGWILGPKAEALAKRLSASLLNS
jgi:DNA-binding IclR family transcriptional regulator